MLSAYFNGHIMKNLRVDNDMTNQILRIEIFDVKIHNT